MFSTTSSESVVYDSPIFDVSRSVLRETALEGEYAAQTVAPQEPHNTQESQTKLKADLGMADAHTVHEVLCEIKTTGNQVRLRYLVVLHLFQVGNLCVELGYSTYTQYCDRELGIPRSTALEYLRVGKALEGLPRLRTLFSEGSLSWQQVRCITRVATLETEISWIDLAAKETTRTLIAEVREAGRTGRSAPRNSARRTCCVCACEGDRDRRQRNDRVCRVCRVDVGRRK